MIMSELKPIEIKEDSRPRDFEAFKLRFPGRVLENKRNYFDEKY